MGKNDKLNKLLHAPFTLRRQLLKMIDNEIKAQQSGQQGRIILRCNGLTEGKIIHALQRASQAGVQIDLIIRGMCCLRPGIEGISENIRVHSIVGRFLEHARVYYFANHEPRVYCASADLMERNLSARIEVGFPIEQPALADRVIAELQYHCDDGQQRWQLTNDGVYNLVKNPEKPSAQAKLLEDLAGFKV